jgi:hypothetical protein
LVVEVLVMVTKLVNDQLLEVLAEEQVLDPQLTEEVLLQGTLELDNQAEQQAQVET